MSETSLTIRSPDSWPAKGQPVGRTNRTGRPTPLPIEVIRQLRAEQERRRITRLTSEQRDQLRADCQASFLAFATQALRSDGYEPAAHHRLLIENLEDVLAGRCTRLMVLMPPGSAKSTYATVLFSAFAMNRRRMQIIGASHTADLARDFSGKIQQRIDENDLVLNYQLRSRAKIRWYTSTGGAYLAAGAGSGIPGFRADLAIIDDPMKGRKAADNQGQRDTVWDWYFGDLERRLRVGGAVILIQTRWHEDDLAGRLLKYQRAKWRVVRLQAIYEPAPDDEFGPDPLGRQRGELLWEDDGYGFGATLPGIRQDLLGAGALREWSAQYQQNPTPDEGAVFKTGNFTYIDPHEIPAGTNWVRAWDFADTEETGTNDPDRTASVKMGMAPGNRIIVADAAAKTLGPDGVDDHIQMTATADGRGVKIGIPQDPGSAGKNYAIYQTRRLIGHNIAVSRETGSKGTRAAPFAAQVNAAAGNVTLVRGIWNAPFVAELKAFPSGRHDDMVDAASRAFMMLDGNILEIWRRAAGITTPGVRMPPTAR